MSLRNECTITFNHEGPIESVAFFRSGTALVTAGENYVKVWDIVAGKLLSTISNHQKTITGSIYSSFNDSLDFRRLL